MVVLVEALQKSGNQTAIINQKQAAQWLEIGAAEGGGGVKS